MSATLARRLLATRYRGMFQILFYNWPFYLWPALIGIAALATAIALPFPIGFKAAAISAIAIGFAWMTGSLWASHHIYDTSGLYEFRWIGELFSPAPRRWVNIHAGLDQTSLKLLELFPAKSAVILDIYDPGAMPEPSIGRARQMTPPEVPSLAADFRCLPLGNRSADAVFLIFAAHEIRDPDERLRFFREIGRVLEPGGKLLLVEHLRDTANFLAFGPGFLHFFARREWLRLAREAGFAPFHQFKITPFVGVFMLGRKS